MLLEVANLSKSFGGVRAVHDVSWAMEAGQTHCIIGPNGAGKSTFFQLLMGRLRADRGLIRFRDVDVTRRHPFERARLGLAVKPQTLGVFGELSVDHNLRLCLQRMANGRALERLLEDRLAHLGLREKRSFLARELSHGENQWLGLGMAMATAPKLLLLDEPTAGMSFEETGRTVELIRSVAASGTSVLVVEHDMAFVRALSVPTTVFDNGRIFMTGAWTEIESNEDVQRLYLGKRGAKAHH
ncbi:MAG: ABC transporter ATP-binding protein [Parvibaculaceae bacterium]